MKVAKCMRFTIWFPKFFYIVAGHMNSYVYFSFISVYFNIRVGSPHTTEMLYAWVEGNLHRSVKEAGREAKLMQA